MMIVTCICGLTVASCSEVDWERLWKTKITAVEIVVPCTHHEKLAIEGEGNAGQGFDMYGV